MRLTYAATAIALLAGSAAAATFTVDTELDLPDQSPGNGICATINIRGSVCSLRAAVMEANALPGNDTILLAAGQTYTLTRAGLDNTAVNGDLDINSTISIAFFASGSRPVVDAGIAERAFDIHAGNVIMLGFDITGGDASAAVPPNGGGILVNAGAGTVQLGLLRLYGNQARVGGGLYNNGDQTTVTLSELFGNSYGGGPGSDRAGAAIGNGGDLVLQGSSVHGNSGAAGGPGTAVDSWPGLDGIGSITVINSTISGNIGAGLWTTDSETVILRNTTIAGNTGIGLRFGGANTHLAMRNTLIAGNDVGGNNGDCQLSQVGTATYNTNRYNLDSDGGCGLAAGSSNFPATDPLLTPLKLRGSVNPVHWPRPDSPAIDRGHPVIGAIGCEPEDQHGRDRPQDFGAAAGDNCDIGAAEVASESIFFDSHETVVTQ